MSDARDRIIVALDLPSWATAECPMCRDGVPVRTDFGKGREFLAGGGVT